MEYLVSRYVDPANPLTGQHKIDKILSEHYSESAKKELIKSRIKEKGQYTLLGQLSVRLDQSRDHYWASVPALGPVSSFTEQVDGCPKRLRGCPIEDVATAIMKSPRQRQNHNGCSTHDKAAPVIMNPIGGKNSQTANL